MLLELVSFSCRLKAPAQHVSGDISNKFMFKWGESTWKMAISSHFPPRALPTTETRQTIIIYGWLDLFYENKRRRWDEIRWQVKKMFLLLWWKQLTASNQHLKLLANFAEDIFFPPSHDKTKKNLSLDMKYCKNKKKITSLFIIRKYISCKHKK